MALLSAFKMSIGKAGIIALLGILFVFLVLVVLVLLLTIFKYVFKIQFKKKAEIPPAPTAPAVQADSADVESETVAAITAAVSIMLEGERQIKAPFVIKSIRRV